ncbi:hypothetical protein QO002_005799 [Pararhizobium capsulatum DSM 1112]|uniref:Uncharacterized protein n=1 Tax=Pararhizobium capsulatum DSM 1112 TaxID=1121113 RepID=A0ABU0BZA5_9HYPH|nr:hypothetical protein [Pararhizobium capsulatum DSM 1112]
MIAQMRTKASEENIPVTLGDMAKTVVPGSFSLVYLVYNTISNLLTQAEQVRCFCNAALHLRSGGRFVVEPWVPELRKLTPGEQAVVWHSEPGYIGLDTYDVVLQQVICKRLADPARLEVPRHQSVDILRGPSVGHAN